MDARYELISPSQRDLILQPLACTWEDQPQEVEPMVDGGIVDFLIEETIVIITGGEVQVLIDVEVRLLTIGVENIVVGVVAFLLVDEATLLEDIDIVKVVYDACFVVQAKI